MAVKIGNNDITLKLGSADVSAAYIGDTLVYSGGTPPIPPTPTYKWVSYNEGDTVPSTTFYGVKLYGLELVGEIDFSTDGHSGVAFIFDTSGGEWTAIDLASYDPIDISEYFDYTEGCYIIYFSDLGYGGLPVEYPQVGSQFEFDIDLYEQI
jgi:hypothetical protein